MDAIKDLVETDNTENEDKDKTMSTFQSSSPEQSTMKQSHQDNSLKHHTLQNFQKAKNSNDYAPAITKTLYSVPRVSNLGGGGGGATDGDRVE